MAKKKVISTVILKGDTRYTPDMFRKSICPEDPELRNYTVSVKPGFVVVAKKDGSVVTDIPMSNVSIIRYKQVNE